MPRSPSSRAGALSRRGFLKLTAAAGAASLAAPYVLRGDPVTGKLKIAVVGCGGQGRSDMKNMLSCGAQVVALCDVDEHQIAEAHKAGGPAVAAARAYGDYRKLLEDENTFDAVVVATPDHWHATLSRAFMKADKHVFCEKPLTHSVAEARGIRELARASKVVTQMGNQGSATASVRRSVEVIKAGGLGQVHDVYVFMDGGGFTHDAPRPAGEDPVPATFNWDAWVGPAPFRPFKGNKTYHPWNWRGWFDFGSGQMGDWGCHAMNIAHRALDLTYAEKIEVLTHDAVGKECTPKSNHVVFHFPARNGLDAVRVHWMDGGPMPDPQVLKVLGDRLKSQSHGALIVGEKGVIFSDGHNLGATIRLEGEAGLKDITRHEGTKSIPVTLPRPKGHYEEWVEACKGGPRPYSDFDTGGHLTEIALSGVMALRVGRTIEWDGEKMQAKGVPEADKIIGLPTRAPWAVSRRSP